LVKEDVPDHGVVVGVPAGQIAWACKCGTTLKLTKATPFRSSDDLSEDSVQAGVSGETTCEYCGNEYRIENGIFSVIKEK